jgi:predicted dehydrogenase
MHLMAAIEAGKHVFIEKPAAVDAPGVKMVMAAGELAKKKGLGIAAGTQRRHSIPYREAIKRIHDGAIGDIVYARCYWNGGQIWVVDREPGWSDMEWQLRNWNYFTWLSGDHIVEQHVHNLDIMNWVIGTHPEKVVSGLGGRQVRTGDVHGHIFDHFAVEFQYPGGVSMFSQCRQINRCLNKVEEFVVGTYGTSNCKNYVGPKKGDSWSMSRREERRDRPYEQEHLNLFASIQKGAPINEAQTVAESTLAGIMGREACYSGQEITWEAAMQSTMRLGPEVYEFGPYPIPPVAMPGIYQFS